MLKSFFIVDEEPQEDKEEKDTGIDWLDLAILIAKRLVARMILDMKKNTEYD